MDITSYLLGKNASGGGGSADLDWTVLGYSKIPQTITDGYNYALDIKTNWTPAKNLSYKFNTDLNLKYMPFVDTSIATNISNMFNRCYFLEKVVTFDTSNVVNATGMFQSCSGLREVPLFNLSKCEQLTNMFSGCNYLIEVPQFNVPSATALYNMFGGCLKLSQASLNNILGMCISATSYASTKTLYYLGLRSDYYSEESIQALPNYQDFINAGWTIGY